MYEIMYIYYDPFFFIIDFKYFSVYNLIYFNFFLYLF